MADIRPFKAVHPAEDKWARVAALPYDVYSRAEARIEAAKDPLSFLNIDRPETQFAEEYDMYAPEVYAKAAQMLRDELDDGTLVQDQAEGYYLYELTMDGRSQTGIVACASIDDYMNNVIRKHENTREDKELDCIRHVDSCSAQTGPIFLAYRKREDIAAVVAKTKTQPPLFAFISEDGITHRGWKIGQKDEIDLIKKAFAQTGTLYIADGHHRAASAVKVGLKRRAENPDYDPNAEFNYFLSVIFPDEELMIMDYNRVVTDLNGLSGEEFLNVLSGKGSLQKENAPVRPAAKGECGVYVQSSWYRFSFDESLKSTDPVEGLDVSILQNEILSTVLGIEDPRTDSRIAFVGGIRGIEEPAERAGDEGAAFIMYPTSIGELFAVADAGRLMPPKSTWFEPKLRSGLFIHLF